MLEGHFELGEDPVDTQTPAALIVLPLTGDWPQRVA